MNLQNIIDDLKIKRSYKNGFGDNCKLPSNDIDLHYVAKAILKRNRKASKRMQNESSK